MTNARSSKRRRGRFLRPKLASESEVRDVPKTYAVLFFNNFQDAINKIDEIKEKKKECDQLNIVLRAEEEVSDATLAPYGKVFRGAAWTLIHKRRVDGGWYARPQP